MPHPRTLAGTMAAAPSLLTRARSLVPSPGQWLARLQDSAASTAASVRKAFVGTEVTVADPRLAQLRQVLPLFNPDSLVGRKGLDVYTDMRLDEQVKSCMALKKAAILGPGWQIEPTSDDAADVTLAEQLTDDLDAMPGTLRGKLWQVLSALEYGFSVQEKLWNIRDRRIVLANLKTRRPHEFQFHTDAHGNIEKIEQLAGAKPILVPPDRIWHYVHQPEWDNPYGRSDLRESYRCFSSDTDILTEAGWRPIAAVTKADRLATLNPETNALEYHEPTRIYAYPYRGKMFHQGGKAIDLLVTPNHRMWVQCGNDTGAAFEFREARDLPKYVAYARTATWAGGEEAAEFVLGGHVVSQRVGNGGVWTHELPGRTVPMDDWLRLFGIWLAEGHTYRSKRGQRAVGITQNPGPTLEAIKQWATACGFTYYLAQPYKGKPAATLYIHNAPLFEYLRQFGKAADKYIPDELKRLPPRQLEILLEAMWLGDGSRVSTWGGRYNTVSRYATTSRRLADDVHECIVKCGGAATIRTDPCTSRLGTKPIYIVSRYSKTGPATCNRKRDRRSWVDYDGTVHCVEVPNHLVYVRRNGKACWSGNSYWHKTHWLQWMSIWGEKLAIPAVVGKHPPAATQQTIDDTLTLLTRMQAATVFTVPQEWEIALLESTRQPREVFVAVLDFFNLMIARGTLLPDKMGLSGGEVKGGSYALAETQLGVWLTVIDFLREQLMEGFREQVLKPMVEFEAPGRPVPKFVLLPLSEEDKQAIIGLWTSAVTAGVVRSTPRDEQHVRQLTEFPELDEDELVQRQEEYDADIEVRDAEREMRKNPPDPMGGGNGKPPGGNGGGSEKRERATGGPKRRDMVQVPATLPGEAQAEKANANVPTTFWRPLRPCEQRADMAAQRDALEAGTSTVGQVLAEVTTAIVEDVRKKAAKLAQATTSPTAVRTLAVSSRILNQAHRQLEAALSGAYTNAARMAVNEVQRARWNVRLSASADVEAFAAGLFGARAKAYFKNKAFFVTDVLAETILQRAKQKLLNALKQDKTERQILFELDETLTPYLPTTDAAGRVVNVPARLEVIARTNIAEAVNEGRWAVFTDPEIEGFVEAVQYSAILDDRVRDNHAAWDGVTRPINDPVWYGPPDRRPPNDFNCRCSLIPVTAADDEEMTPDEELPDVEVVGDGFK